MKVKISSVSGKVSGTQTKKAYKVKTIDISALEWFDKVNGNSYFSATVHLNFGAPDERKIYLGFQYGYGSQYESEARQQLITRGFIPECYSLYSYCQENGIILRSNKVDRCKKRELMKWDEAEQLNQQTK